ncbi:hypothetical protein RJZ56_004051 [Blastomyces dermatitidis]|uniref:Cytochrome c oxidase assembly protein COX20, mitochondrial n=3 Tax=Blastomyces TaxID=229219 RepID=A0A179U6Z3_BLAGS|nr:uncharacterized protein BDBG_00483 [Blastomyces gilchristii SLH14081]XP_045273412.1 uncharacterized protein BDCG_08999 [Blastomyces dermatitidis ER-3]EGE84328.1 hypothetical protein BDDG_07273 [Blastomyces dermatitidis ATCC 18188]EQL34144.1 hypothetical protein BDFG_04049 [Blastomyces dermatitidis ATCC 26199]EEQ85730.1 hypothetical protein BDCG_08999 [Blastomyces dermatitidis ER-3]OAT03805.1 hypothetical protein BDBG_00483 [Blastomyces gilchristii SLH14081]
MAEDSRDTQSPTGDTSNVPPEFSPTKKPKHEFPKSQAAKMWEEFGNPEEPINLIPGAYNSAGGKPKAASFRDAFQSMSLDRLLSFYKVPCARDSLLVGIGAGFGVGSLKAVLGGLRAAWPACNWAVGTFAVASIGMYEFCQRRRVQERDGIKEAVELMRDLKIKKLKERERAKAEAEAAAAEEERRRKSWTNLSNYKFW